MKALLPWARYHGLDQYARAIIDPSPEQIELYTEESHLNIVHDLSDDDATAIANAFNQLCVAAWTPNQSQEARDTNRIIIDHSMQVLAGY